MINIETLQICVLKITTNSYEYNHPQIRHSTKIYEYQNLEQVPTRQNVLKKKVL